MLSIKSQPLSNASHCTRLANETHAITFVQAGTQANQFASAIDRTGNITNFTENRSGKSFFFSETQKRLAVKLLCLL